MSTTISASGKNKHVLDKTQARISNSYQEKKMLDGFSIIQQFCSVINAPTFVLDEAKNLHYTMGEKRHKYTRGCWTEAMYAATVLAAAKRASFGITFKEVAKLLKIQEKALRKNYAQLLKIIGNEPQGTEGTDSTTTHPSRTSPSLLTVAFFPPFCSPLLTFSAILCIHFYVCDHTTFFCNKQLTNNIDFQHVSGRFIFFKKLS
eukprot:Phypoly_transcript_11561.p1 GENE.Phypoly_transcript_11561~~Phypoly_transcript_11561.p1  ORF type:complete len:235 (+),score=22.32 Phypoly_transcript_11561:95-706(+)